MAEKRAIEVWYTRLDVDLIADHVGARWRARTPSGWPRTCRARRRSTTCARCRGSPTRWTASRGSGATRRCSCRLESCSSDDERGALHARRRGGAPQLPGDACRRPASSSTTCYRYRDMARKVVGVGSVGTRAWIVLLARPRRRRPAVPAGQGGAGLGARALRRQAASSATHGRRVVEGQRLMQAVERHPARLVPRHRVRRASVDFYVRQLWDGKGSFNVEAMTDGAWHTYAEMCAWTLARAHARSGDRIAIAALPGRRRRLRQGRRRLRRRVRGPEPAGLRRAARGGGRRPGQGPSGRLNGPALPRGGVRLTPIRVRTTHRSYP